MSDSDKKKALLKLKLADLKEQAGQLKVNVEGKKKEEIVDALIKKANQLKKKAAKDIDEAVLTPVKEKKAKAPKAPKEKKVKTPKEPKAKVPKKPKPSKQDEVDESHLVDETDKKVVDISKTEPEPKSDVVKTEKAPWEEDEFQG